MTRVLSVASAAIIGLCVGTALYRAAHPVSSLALALGGVVTAWACAAKIDAPALRHSLRLCGGTCWRCYAVRREHRDARRDAALRRHGAANVARSIGRVR